MSFFAFHLQLTHFAKGKNGKRAVMKKNKIF